MRNHAELEVDLEHALEFLNEEESKPIQNGLTKKITCELMLNDDQIHTANWSKNLIVLCRGNCISVKIQILPFPDKRTGSRKQICTFKWFLFCSIRTDWQLWPLSPHPPVLQRREASRAAALGALLATGEEPCHLQYTVGQSSWPCVR